MPKSVARKPLPATIVSGTGKAQGDGSLSRQLELCIGRSVCTRLTTIKLWPWACLGLYTAGRRASCSGGASTEADELKSIWGAVQVHQRVQHGGAVFACSQPSLQRCSSAPARSLTHEASSSPPLVAPQIRRGPSSVQPSANQVPPRPLDHYSQILLPSQGSLILSRLLYESLQLLDIQHATVSSTTNHLLVARLPLHILFPL